MREMGNFAGVPIEPPEQTALLDTCMSVAGVIGGGVPGGKSDRFLLTPCVRPVLNKSSFFLSSLSWWLRRNLAHRLRSHRMSPTRTTLDPNPRCRAKLERPLRLPSPRHREYREGCSRRRRQCDPRIVTGCPWRTLLVPVLSNTATGDEGGWQDNFDDGLRFRVSYPRNHLEKTH